jgi:hypothetical protein
MVVQIMDLWVVDFLICASKMRKNQHTQQTLMNDELTKIGHF